MCVRKNLIIIKEIKINLKIINVFWFRGKKKVLCFFVIIEDILYFLLK